RERQARARAMALAELEVGDGERAVERRVQGDGDDHGSHPAIVLPTRVAYQPAPEGTPREDVESAAPSRAGPANPLRARTTRAPIAPHVWPAAPRRWVAPPPRAGAPRPGRGCARRAPGPA